MTIPTGNERVKSILEEKGIESTTNLTKSQYEDIMERLQESDTDAE